MQRIAVAALIRDTIAVTAPFALAGLILWLRHRKKIRDIWRTSEDQFKHLSEER